MVDTISSTTVVLLILVMCHADVPLDYILRITPDCGEDAVGDAVVRIITDLRAEAVAICEDDTHVLFNNTDGVNLVLDVSYPDQGNRACVFQKRRDSEVYVIQVYVSWGEPGNPVHQDEEEFYVTCTYDENGNKRTDAQTVAESLIAPVEIQTHLGDEAISTFNLQIIDVLDQLITDDSIPLGRIVRLSATTDGASGENGIKPVACDAIGAQTGRRYAVLRAGCGDGVVFDKAEGFVTTDLTTVSPYFSAFDMAGEPSIQFECNFTLCESVCNGSSCLSERKRRSEDGEEDAGIRWVNGTLYFIDPNSTSKLEDDMEKKRQDLVIWAAFLGIGSLSLFSVTLSLCVLARHKATHVVTVK